MVVKCNTLSAYVEVNSKNKRLRCDKPKLDEIKIKYEGPYLVLSSHYLTPAMVDQCFEDTVNLLHRAAMNVQSQST